MLTRIIVDYIQAQATEILARLDQISAQVGGLSDRVERLEQRTFNFSTLIHMDTKPLFQSKEFWLALIALVFFIIQGFTKIPVPPDAIDQVAALDWSNIVGALTSAAIIILRAFFTKTKIVGIA